MENKDVFISYKAEETAEALWVKTSLEQNGISCWMAPTSIPGGSSYAKEITHAIENCKVFVLILSQQAQLSTWIPKEIDMALNYRKIILPFMIENCKLVDDFNFYLNNVQRYEAYLNKASAIEMMIKQIQAITGISDNTPVVIEKPEGEVKTEPKTLDVPIAVSKNNENDEYFRNRQFEALREETRGNRAKALQIHRELAEKGYAPSINYMGIAYILGELVEQNLPLGVEYYRKSAELGYAPAQLNLGDCYMNGMGIETDKEEAVKWYLLAATNPEEPDGDAMFRLFLCYKFGKGVTPDKAEAEKWQSLAKEQGVTEYIDYYCR